MAETRVSDTDLAEYVERQKHDKPLIIQWSRRDEFNLKTARELQELRAQSRWVKVSERLPEMPDRTKFATGNMVLVDVLYRVVPAYFEADGKFHWLAGGIINGVTRWRSLPAPTEEDK